MLKHKALSNGKAYTIQHNMKLTILLETILLSSCLNIKDPIISRQKAIKKEMEQVKADYF